MPIEIPDFALIALIGASGSGKSTFATRHFLPSEILSSDHYRAVVSDDETDQAATKDAFDALHHIAAIRLRRRKTVVIDATNVQAGARKPLIDLARRFHAVPVAIVVDTPEKVCLERNIGRTNRDFGPHVVKRHIDELHRSLRGLEREGFRVVVNLRGLDQIEAVTFARVPLRPDKRSETGPFDIIGDIHGCYTELCTLLTTLGYAPDNTTVWRHEAGRRAIFVGDLVDRGPGVVPVVNLVMAMCAAGTAFCVPGNHDDKLKKNLQGRRTSVRHGLETSLAQIEALDDTMRAGFIRAYVEFIEALPTHLWLDGGTLAVAHAGVLEEMQGRSSGTVRSFALYGDTTGETDDEGLPVRLDWAKDYRGQAAVVYGHTPVFRPQWLNNAINIDTGAVFGGLLTALRWPEREIVSIQAAAQYAEPARPLNAENALAVSEQWEHDEVLDIADYTGRKTIETRLAKNMVIAEENAAAALEIMSRFAVHPRWLMYLPPTMSPVETSKRPEYLEHPDEGFAYFVGRDVETVVCEEKHMGSRAVLVICRDGDAARLRFGAPDGETGAIVTRTGRPFFDASTTHEVLTELARALSAANFWDTWATDWVCLDAEVMPWNAKAQGLLREQYAPVGAAGVATLGAESAAWEQAVQRGLSGAADYAEEARLRLHDLARYREAYARYCWTVTTTADLKIAPFHLLATEGKTYTDRPHTFHMETLTALSEYSPLLQQTNYRIVHLSSDTEKAETTAWWEARTEAGAEGMVVKPLDFIVSGCQPAVKVRGREYLRIIYGPEYTQPANLARLRARGLGRKRGLAMREFALGIESLERFVRREPLRRVHECVFAVLALESEPVDPRL